MGILTFDIISCQTQFYNSTRNHTYMFGHPWFYSTEFSTRIVGILAFEQQRQYLILQFYKNSHIYDLSLNVEVNSTGYNTWFVGILTFDIISWQTQFYNSTRNHTYMFGGPWFYSTEFSTRIVGFLTFEQLMQYIILQFYKNSHIYDLLLQL